MSIDSPTQRRRFPRIHGPFDAWCSHPIRTQVRIIDLGLGGCFVTATTAQEHETFTMSIDLGTEGVVDVMAAAIYHRPHGSAVSFDNLTADAHERIQRTVATVTNRLSVPDDGAITRRLN